MMTHGAKIEGVALPASYMAQVYAYDGVGIIYGIFGKPLVHFFASLFGAYRGDDFDRIYTNVLKGVEEQTLSRKANKLTEYMNALQIRKLELEVYQAELAAQK